MIFLLFCAFIALLTVCCNVGEARKEQRRIDREGPQE
jgi:hypothetical protein